MQEVQGTQHVVAECDYVLLGEGVRLQLVEDRVEVEVDAFHNQEDVVEILIKTVGCFTRWNENVYQFWRKDIIVHLRKPTHDHDFPHHLPALVVAPENIAYQFYCHNTPRLDFSRLNDLSKGALAEQGYWLVAAADSLPDCAEFHAFLLLLCLVLHNQ